MTRMLIPLLFCVFVSALQVWTLEYESSWYGHPMGDNIPRFTLFQRSLTECLHACVLRPWCEVVGYHKYGFCQIFFENISSEQTQCNKEDCREQDQSMMFVKRIDLTTKEKRKCDKTCPFDSTKPLQRCDLTAVTPEKCPIDACPPFDKKDPNGKILGNTHELGHKRRLLCNLGYRPIDPNNVTSECQGGRWTKVTSCVQVCPPFENKSKGNVVGDSLIEGATRNLTCNQNYSPRNTTNVVSRCANGQWSPITECVKVCPPFDEIKNGTVVGDSLLEGAIQTLQCKQNYSPRNTTNVESRCENGQWSTITECVEDCPQFIPPKFATVWSERISTHVGSTQTLTCWDQYKPLNASKITSVCDNGVWSSVTRCVQDKCVYPAFEFKQSIYLFTNLSDNFTDAVAFCTGCDGHVITIDDEEEQQWVNKTASTLSAQRDFWLGITKTNANATRIHDQANVSYYHWARGQPNNYGGIEHCVRGHETMVLGLGRY